MTESFVGLRSVSGSTGYSTYSRTTYGGTVGWMKNRDDGSAVGGAIEVSNVGITGAARYRKWIGRRTAVDVGLGPRWEPGRIEVVDLTTSLLWSDLIGVTAAVAHDFGRGSSEFRLGVRSGSWIGVTTYAAALTGVITWLILWDPD